MLAAQIVGAAGYGILVLATFAQKRLRFLILDVLGLLPVAGHYLMLGATAGATLSLLYMGFDIVAALATRQLARRAYWLFYPVACLLGWWFWSGPSDFLAIVGTLFAVASRQQTQVWRIQALIAISALGWGAFGIAVGSMAQIAFSSVYGIAATANAIRFVRMRHAEVQPNRR